MNLRRIATIRALIITCLDQTTRFHFCWLADSHRFEVVKAQTKSEKLRERQFTPTPPSSDDEDDGRRRRDRGKDRDREDRRGHVDRRRESADRKEKEKEVRSSSLLSSCFADVITYSDLF